MCVYCEVKCPDRVAQNDLSLSLSLSYRLEEIIHQDSKFYLVFEFMSMDLKKYLDTIPAGQYIDPVLLKVVMDT